MIIDTRAGFASTFGVLLGALGLVACAPSDHEDAIDHDEIAQTMRRLANAGEFFQAGQWESTSQILQLDGIGESEAAELKKRIGRQTFSTCLAPEDVSEPDIDFFTGEASDCVYSQFAMADGEIEARMRCVTGQIVQDNHLIGTYAPDRYDFTLTSVGDGKQAPAQTMVMAIAARRVGDCATLTRARKASTGEE